ERGRYLGLLGAVYIVAAVGGPLLGGLAVDHLTWRWIFGLYPPLAVVALVVVARTLRLPVPQRRRPFDVLGAALLSIAVTGLVLPLRTFRTRAVAIPTAISLIIGFALFGTISYLPAFLQVARGASATQAGLVVTALMAGVLITTTVSGRMITRTGRYKAFPV